MTNKNLKFSFRKSKTVKGLAVAVIGILFAIGTPVSANENKVISNTQDVGIVAEIDEIVSENNTNSSEVENSITLNKTEVPATTISLQEKSKWSIVDYKKIEDSSLKESDKIVIDNLYTTPQRIPNTQSSEETTIEEAAQTYEHWLFYSSGSYIKLVASDYHESNLDVLKNIKLNTKEDISARTLSISVYELKKVLDGSYLTNYTQDPTEIFKLSHDIPESVFAMAKASKLRADQAKEHLVSKNLFTEENEGTYNLIVNYYNQIENSFNAKHVEQYSPIYKIDDDYTIPSSDIEELKTTISKLPREYQSLFSNVLVVGASNIQDKRLTGVLGYASEKREITLNGTYRGIVGTSFHEVGHIVDFMSGHWDNGVFKNSFSRQADFQQVWKTGYANARPYYRDQFYEAFADGFGRWIEYKYMGNSNAFKGVGNEVKVYFENLEKRIFPTLNSVPVPKDTTKPTTTAPVNGTSNTATTPSTNTTTTTPSTSSNTATTIPSTTTKEGPSTDTRYIKKDSTTPNSYTSVVYKADPKLVYGKTRNVYENGKKVVMVGTYQADKVLKVGKKTITIKYVGTVDSKTGKVTFTTKKIYS